MHAGKEEVLITCSAARIPHLCVSWKRPAKRGLKSYHSESGILASDGLIEYRGNTVLTVVPGISSVHWPCGGKGRRGTCSDCFVPNLTVFYIEI